MTQLYDEDMDIGTEMPSLNKRPSPRQLVKWAGAVGDWQEIHYDKDTATKQGLPGIIVQGWLVFAFLGEMVTNCAGEWGDVKKISCNYRKMCIPGEDIVFKGRVARRFVENGVNLTECDIWAEKTNGEKAAEGRAIVRFPSRGTAASFGAIGNRPYFMAEEITACQPKKMS